MPCNFLDIDKKHVKIQKYPDKIVGGVLFTRSDTICDRQSDGRTGKAICLLTLTGGGGT